MNKSGFASILFFIKVMTCLGTTHFVSYPLNDREVYKIYISQMVPTTLSFPGAIESIDGVDVCMENSEKKEGNVLLSFSPGDRYLTMRGLKNDSRAAINIVYNRKIYVFDVYVTHRVAPNRTVELQDISKQVSLEKPIFNTDPITLNEVLHFMNKVKLAEAIRSFESIERYELNHLQTIKATDIVLMALSRDITRRIVVGTVYFKNKGLEPFCYVPSPTKVGIRIGNLSLKANLCDMSGQVLGQTTSIGHFAIVGDAIRTGFKLNQDGIKLFLAESRYGMLYCD